jgi:hypothetical protein
MEGKKGKADEVSKASGKARHMQGKQWKASNGRQGKSHRIYS